jgi:hypothetical protein
MKKVFKTVPEMVHYIDEAWGTGKYWLDVNHVAPNLAWWAMGRDPKARPRGLQIRFKLLGHWYRLLFQHDTTYYGVLVRQEHGPVIAGPFTNQNSVMEIHRALKDAVNRIAL